VQRKSRIRRLVVWGMGLLLWPTVTLAATKTEPETELFGGSQWILSLLSLILVVFLAYWVTRFLAGRCANSAARHLKVVESLCLGSNRHLYLLTVNKQTLLIGSTEQGLALIKEYNDPDFFKELSVTAAQQNKATGKLTACLAPLLKNQAAQDKGSALAGQAGADWSGKIAMFLKPNSHQFKNVLTTLLNGQKPTATPETPRIALQERLAESLERIRAWKTKGRG
jgi:flagellar biogenesis protein FliO